MKIEEEIKQAEVSSLFHSIQTSLWKADVWALRCLIEVEKTSEMKAAKDDLRKLASEIQSIISKMRELRNGVQRD